MGMLDISIMQKYIQMANDGWEQGWHERNGGNLTYRLTADEVAEMKPFFDAEPRPWVNMGVTGENLAGEYFISTGSGKFFRNVILHPEDSLCVVEINDKGDSYRIVWGLVNGGKPTSEFLSHYMNHCVRAKATNGACRVIYHAHPANLIAMTFVLPLTDRDFSRELWKVMTECPVIFPGGLGVVPWMVPGGADIAMATCKKMEKYDAAIWAHHGLFASGPDFDITFGLMHTIEKAAQIWILKKSTGLPELTTISDDDLRAIGRDFNVVIREEFLD